MPGIGDVIHELTTDEITIGRGSENKVQIKDGSVSPRHARLVRSGTGYRLEDLNSTSSTFVNGSAVREFTLAHSSPLRFGAIEAFFRVDAASSVTDQLHEQIADLQRQLSAVRQARDTIHHRNEQLLAERDEAFHARDLAVAELGDARGQGENDDASKGRLEELEAQLERLRRESAEKSQSHDQFEARIAESERLREASEERVRQLAFEIEALKAGRESQVKAATSRTSELEAMLADKETELEQRDAASKADTAALTDRYESQLLDLRKEMEAKTSGADSQNAALAELEKTITTLRQELEERQSKVRELEDKATEAEQTSAGSSERVESLEAQLAESTRNGELLEGENGRLAAELEARQAALAEAASRLEAEGKRTTDLAAQLEALQQRSRQELDENMRAAQAELEKLRTELDGAQQRLGELELQAAEAEEASSGSSEHLKELEAQLAETAQAAGHLREERDRLTADFEARQADLSRASSELEAEVNRHRELAAHLKSAQTRTSQIESERDQATQRSVELQAKLDAIAMEGEAAGSRAEELVRELEGLRERLAAAERDSAESRNQAGELQSALETLRAETEAATNTATDRAAELDVLRSAIPSLEKERDEEARRANDLEVHLHNITGERDSLRGELASLSAEFESARNGSAAAEHERGEREQRISHLENEASSMAAERDSAREELRTVQEQLEHVRQSQAEQQRTIEALREELASAKQDLESSRVNGSDPGHAEESASPQIAPHVEAPAGNGAHAAAPVVTERLSSWLGIKRSKDEKPAPTERSNRSIAPQVVERDKSTLAKVPEQLNKLRRELQYLIRHPRDMKTLNSIIDDSAALVSMTSPTVFQAVYSMAAALDSLLRDLRDTPERINQATLRTVTQSLDFVGTLVENDTLNRTLELPAPHVLAVDDEPMILEAIVGAMEMVGLQASGTGEPQEALERLSREQVDLIFLDVRLPDVSGWDICAKIRAMPEHKKTPVVFLTGLATIENKVQSTLQGGNDFIGKPFNLRELGIKGLTWVYRGQLGLS